MTATAFRAPSHFNFAAPITLDSAKKTTWAQILVTGEWMHPRYGKLAITSEKLKELKDNFDAGARDFVYADYDHGIANAKGDGNAIAAGEVIALELRSNDTELWAEFEPTEPAREKILAKEYRRTSADFIDDYRDKKTGKKWGAVLRGFALTNIPYIEGMQPLALGDAHGDARLFADYTKESSMKIAEKLGLSADASDEQITAAIDKLNSDAGKATTLSESLNAATGTIGEVRGVLKLAEDTDDDAVVAAVRTLAEKNASLEKKDREAAADKLLTDAIAAGKVPPAMKDTFREQLLSDNQAVADAAKSVIEKMPKVVPLNEKRSDGSTPPVQDREKLLDETIKKKMTEDPKLTYGDALILAENEVNAALGGEK
jgi:phage I-like protein